MVLGIIIIILGGILFVISWILPEKLVKNGFYIEQHPPYAGFNRITILLTIYGMIFPKAYFKPNKARDGREILILAFCLFVIGLLLISMGLVQL